MALTAFYAAPLVVKGHILAALTVAALTPVQFWGFRKGSQPHRATGYVWLGAMLAVALTSLFMTSNFRYSVVGFGPIHLLSLVSLLSIYVALRHARGGNVAAHRKTLIFLALGFWVAAAFTFMPQRLMWQIVVG